MAAWRSTPYVAVSGANTAIANSYKSSWVNPDWLYSWAPLRLNLRSCIPHPPACQGRRLARQFAPRGLDGLSGHKVRSSAGAVWLDGGVRLQAGALSSPCAVASIVVVRVMVDGNGGGSGGGGGWRSCAWVKIRVCVVPWCRCCWWCGHHHHRRRRRRHRCCAVLAVPCACEWCRRGFKACKYRHINGVKIGVQCNGGNAQVILLGDGSLEDVVLF